MPCCPPCLVKFYDCLRAWANPASVRTGTCGCGPVRGACNCCCPWICVARGKGELDVHEYYYQEFQDGKAQGGGGGAPTAYQAELRKAKKMVEDLVKAKSCAPILVRLAWHDSGTYDKNNASRPWPNAGGAIGSIITDHEINAAPNAGLKKGYTSYLQPIKTACPSISWADLIQLASATAIEVEGGPVIPMKYGRQDGTPTQLEPVPFGLPGVCFDEDPVAHLKIVFYKYNMDDKDIVALSGAHTLGRAFNDRSGTVKEGSGGPYTQYTQKSCPAYTGANSLTQGGRSWTKNWTKFDNSYFADMHKADPECIAFPTDKCLMTAPEFKVHFDQFAASQQAFFEAYKVSHKKLSELGCKFVPEGGVTL